MEVGVLEMVETLKSLYGRVGVQEVVAVVEMEEVEVNIQYCHLQMPRLV